MVKAHSINSKEETKHDEGVRDAGWIFFYFFEGQGRRLAVKRASRLMKALLGRNGWVAELGRSVSLSLYAG